ncbi:MAG: MaoC family dehydratase N-terminal domain-containing protein [Candidatus Nanopelagicales bacterium]|jgi:acyl dehydratase|nr:MaoC family dehydratase N-terminal domain-containing protein [Candidatus Nanopelagicales bacterium]
MPLNPEFIGKRYPDTDPYLIGREKIREFATAIGDSSPVFHSLDAARALGYPDLPAPPTFAFSLTMKAMATAMFDPELGLDYARVVHGEQGFEYKRPMTAGDEVVVKSFIADITARGRNEYLTTQADVVTVSGELLVSTRSIIASRGTAA